MQEYFVYFKFFKPMDWRKISANPPQMIYSEFPQI